MANYTKFINKTYADIGNVTIKFNDDTKITHYINQIDSGNPTSPNVGTFFDENSTRTPVEIELLDGKWEISELPVKVNYPDGEEGGLSYQIFYNSQEIWGLFLNE